MSLNTYRLGNTSFQEFPLTFDVSGLSQIPSTSSQNSSFIDLTVPGNRLAQQENGEIILIPKTPAEVVGEQLLRPLIDGIYSLTSHLFSKLPDSSSLQTYFSNFRWTPWKMNIHTSNESSKKTDVVSISSLRDKDLPSSETLNQVSQHHIASKSKNLPDFDFSAIFSSKAMLAFDRLLTRCIPSLPMASAQDLTENGKLTFHPIGESPLSFDEVIALTQDMLEHMPVCRTFLPEMLSWSELLKFAGDGPLNRACEEFVRQKSDMLHKLEFIRLKYNRMEWEARLNVLYALKTERYFNKERELFEKGENSLFLQSGSEPKKIWITSPEYSEDHIYIPESKRFKNPTTCQEFHFDVFDADFKKEELDRMRFNEDTHKILIPLLEDILESFSTFFSEEILASDLGDHDKKNLLTDGTAADVKNLLTDGTAADVSLLTAYNQEKNSVSVHQMQLVFNDASIERLKNRNQKIIENMRQKLGPEVSDSMMKETQQIENEIIEMLKKIPVVIEDEPDSCVASDQPAQISRLAAFSSLAGLSLLIVTLYKYFRNEDRVRTLEDSGTSAESQSVKPEPEEKASVLDSEPTSQSSADSVNDPFTDKLDGPSSEASKASEDEKLLRELTLKIFTLSISGSEDEKKAIMSLFNDKLTAHDEYIKNREAIASEIRSMIFLEETSSNEESQIKEKLKNLGCGVCEIFHHVLIEINQKPQAPSQVEFQSCG